MFAACSSNSSGGGLQPPRAARTRRSRPLAVSSGGNLTYALDEDLAGFNVNTSADSEFVLQEILDVVWPQVFITNPQLQPVPEHAADDERDADVARVPRPIVYVINPKAVWQDGTPIDGADFVYNYDAQSGNAACKDVGGKAFDDASTTGYNQIKSITASSPPNGAACTTITLEGALPPVHCGNGDTVTVVFSKPFADWKSLFSDIVPEHIATTVGWNTGFNSYQKVLSGSWYEIKSYAPNSSLVLQRNPKYWGTPGKLDTITFSFISDDSQEVPALQNNEVNLINPASVSLSIVQQADQVTGINKPRRFRVSSSSTSTSTRRTRTWPSWMSARRSPTAPTARRSSPARSASSPRGSTPSATACSCRTSPATSTTAAPTRPSTPRRRSRFSQSAGYTMGSDGYFQSGGKDLTLTISSTTGNTLQAGHRRAVPEPDEGDRHQDHDPELRRQHLLRHEPADRRLRHRRVRVGLHSVPVR